MLKKLKSFFSPTPSLEESKDGSKTSSEVTTPLDVLFAENFTEGGSQFIYCENPEEAKTALVNIFTELQSKHLYCKDKPLIRFLEETKIPFRETFPEKSTDKKETCFITCENLIAYDGRIVLSSDQIGKNKPKNLPQNYIIWARPNQFVYSISDSLREIKKNKSPNIPNNITCIVGKRVLKFEDTTNSKNIYLLVVE